MRRHLRVLKVPLTAPPGFPNPQVKEAFENPSIDKSTEPFTWGQLNVSGIQLFIADKLGWSPEKTDALLKPALDRIKSIGPQRQLTQYFLPEPSKVSTLMSLQIMYLLLILQQKAETGKGSRLDIAIKNVARAGAEKLDIPQDSLVTKKPLKKRQQKKMPNSSDNESVVPTNGISSPYLMWLSEYREVRVDFPRPRFKHIVLYADFRGIIPRVHFRQT